MAAKKPKDTRKVWLKKQEKEGKPVKPFYGFLPAELHEEIRTFAFHAKVSMGVVVRQALQEFMDRQKTAAKKKSAAS